MATTYTTTQNGDIFTAGSWVGGVAPTNDPTDILVVNHAMTLATPLTCASITKVSGTPSITVSDASAAGFNGTNGITCPSITNVAIVVNDRALELIALASTYNITVTGATTTFSIAFGAGNEAVAASTAAKLPFKSRFIASADFSATNRGERVVVSSTVIGTTLNIVVEGTTDNDSQATTATIKRWLPIVLTMGTGQLSAGVDAVVVGALGCFAFAGAVGVTGIVQTASSRVGIGNSGLVTSIIGDVTCTSGQAIYNVTAASSMLSVVGNQQCSTGQAFRNVGTVASLTGNQTATGAGYSFINITGTVTNYALATTNPAFPVGSMEVSKAFVAQIMAAYNAACVANANIGYAYTNGGVNGPVMRWRRR